MYLKFDVGQPSGLRGLRVSHASTRRFDDFNVPSIDILNIYEMRTSWGLATDRRHAFGFCEASDAQDLKDM